MFVAAADRMGWEHGCDLFALQDAAEDIVRPLQDRPVRVDRETLTRLRGCLLEFPAPRRGRRGRYGVDARDILLERPAAAAWSAGRRT